MKKSYIIATIIALGIMAGCFALGNVTAPAKVVEVETVKPLALPH